MNIIKKIGAGLAAAMVFVTTGLTSFADSIYDTAEEIYCGEQISDTIYHWKYSDDDYPNDFKITSTSEGELVLSIYANQEFFCVYVYDSNGNEIPKTKNDIKIGYSVKPEYLHNWCVWNDVTEVFEGKLIYNIEKGTYYIRITQGTLYEDFHYVRGSGDFTLTAFFPDLTDETADVNNDGVANARDALYILQLVVKGEKPDKKFDVDKDGYVTAKDALAIVRYAISK